MASRRPNTYWLRCGAAGVVIVLGTFCFMVMQRDSASREIAMTLFGIMTGSAVLYALLAGTRSTADCLSGEKREGTLGLLFLTDLKGYDIVFGKLAATSLSAFYGVLAVVPILAVPLLMGGVALAEFGRMALVAVNTLFFSLAVGIGVSALSVSARKAAGTTLLLLLCFTMFVPVVGISLTELSKVPNRFLPYFFLSSPGATFATAFDIVYKNPGTAGFAAWKVFWWSLATVHFLGWLFLIVACWRAPRVWQDRPAGTAWSGWLERCRQWSYGTPEDRSAFRRRLLNQNAFYWLSSRVRSRPAYVWGVLGLLGCGWAWGAAKYHRDWLMTPMFILTAIVLNLVIKIWVAAEVGRQLAEDRKNGTLELLLSTPLTVPDILRGQMLALLRQFLGPVLTVVVIWVVLLLASVARSRVDSVNGDDFASMIWFWVALMAMLVPDLLALHWVGLWQALTAKHPGRVAGGAAGRILVLPWALLLITGMTLPVISAVDPYQNDLGPKFFISLWLVSGLMADIGFGLWSKRKLLTEFRLVAEQRYTKPAGFWKGLFSSGTH